MVPVVFLTNVAGLSAGMASNIRLVSGVWDAGIDPIVGVLSDRTRSRWGDGILGCCLARFL
jgi:GPH family glycoside/pentoside/hexuronide:cation symporter